MLKTLLTVMGVALAFGNMAQDRRQPLSLDPTIANVDSGGFWMAAGQGGHYRAVTYSNCSEDCHYNVVIEWLSEKPVRVVARKQITEVGDLTVVTEVRFVLSNGGARLQIRHKKDGVGKWVHCLRLGAPGQYTEKEGECEPAG